jgi:hypothetical protein
MTQLHMCIHMFYHMSHQLGVLFSQLEIPTYRLIVCWINILMQLSIA